MLPAGLSFVSQIQPQSGPQLTLGNTGNTINDTISDLPTGQSQTLLVLATVDPAATDGTQFVNTATVATTTTNIDPNTSSSVTTTVQAKADLAVTKSGPATVLAGQNATYTISVTNNVSFNNLTGTSTVDAQQVSLSDVLPAGVSFVSQSQSPNGPQFTLGNAGNAITDTIGDLSAGASQTFTVIAAVPANTADGTQIVNTATVATTSTNSSPNTSSSVTTTVGTQASLSLAQTAPPSVTAGTDSSYTVTLSNAGPSDAQTVSLTDAVPAGTTFVSASPISGSNPDGFAFSEAAGTVTGTPTGGVVAAGNQDVFVLVVHALSADAPGSMIQNSVTATAADGATTSNAASSGMVAAAGITITESDSAGANSATGANGTVVPGTGLTYTITLSNGGPSDAAATAVTDQFPVAFTGAGYTTTVSGGATDANPSGSGNIADTVDLVAAGSVTYTVVGTVASGATGAVTNRVALQPAQGVTDTNAAQSAAVSDNLTPQADVSVSMTGPSAATAGLDVTYTITVTNSGPSDAQQVDLADTLPGTEAFGAQSQTANGAQFTLTDQGNAVDDTIGTLPAGASQTITLVAAVRSDTPAGTQVVDTATVGTTTTNTSANTQARVTTTVTTATDLAITLNGPTTVTAGNDITYTVSLSNLGPSDAQNVVLIDNVPDGTDFVAAVPVVGSNPDGFTFASTSGFIEGTPQGGVVAAGNVDVFSLIVQASSSDAAGSTISDTASAAADVTNVGGGGRVYLFEPFGGFGLFLRPRIFLEPASAFSRSGQFLGQAGSQSGGNDAGLIGHNGNQVDIVSSTVNATVVTQAALSVAVGGPTTVTAGTDIGYTVTLSNAGPSDAQAVSLTDAVPAGTTFVSANPVSGSDPDGFTFTEAAGTVTGTPTGGEVFAGDQEVAVLVFHALSNAAPGSTIQDAVSVSTTDGSTAADSTSSRVVAAADLTITQSDSGGGNSTTSQQGAAIPGTGLTYTITLSNSGPSDAAGTVVTDQLPAGFIGASYTTTAAGGASDSRPTGSGNLADTVDLVAGGSITYTVVGTVAPGATGTLTNTAILRLAQGVVNTGPTLSASDTDQLQPQAAVSVSMDGPSDVTAGLDVTFTITVTNGGPSDARNVELNDSLPDSLALSSQVQGAGTRFRLSESGNRIDDTLATLTAGASQTFTVVAAVPADTADQTLIVNTADVGTSTFNSSQLTSATDFTTVESSAALSITQTGPAAVTAGTDATYTIALSNAGPSDADTLNLTDAVPAGTSFVSAFPVLGSNPDGFSFAATAGSVVGTPLDGVVPAGSQDTFTLVFHVLSSDLAGSTVSNTATVTTVPSTPGGGGVSSFALLANPGGGNAGGVSFFGVTGPGGSGGNQNGTPSATVTSTVQTLADVSVSATGTTSTTAGSDVTYTLTVSNAGPSDAAGVQLSDDLPQGETFVSASAGAGSNTTFTDNISTLATGVTTKVTIVAHVGDGASGDLVDTAQVGATTPDNDDANNHASFTTSVTQPGGGTNTGATPPNDQSAVIANAVFDTQDPGSHSVDNGGSSPSRSSTALAGSALVGDGAVGNASDSFGIHPAPGGDSTSIQDATMDRLFAALSQERVQSEFDSESRLGTVPLSVALAAEEAQQEGAVRLSSTGHSGKHDEVPLELVLPARKVGLLATGSLDGDENMKLIGSFLKEAYAAPPEKKAPVVMPETTVPMGKGGNEAPSSRPSPADRGGAKTARCRPPTVLWTNGYPG